MIFFSLSSSESYEEIKTKGFLISNRALSSLDVIESWDLPYHAGRSLELLGKYCTQGKGGSGLLKKAMKHLLLEFSNEYMRRREDCRQSLKLSPCFTSQTWSDSKNIKGILHHLHQLKKTDHRLHHTEMAIKYLESEIALQKAKRTR